MAKPLPIQRVTFRFYAELNDFLSPELRMRAFARALFLPSSVKDVIESLGAPHTEVDLILANGVPEGFSYLVQHADYISVYPRFTWLDVSSLVQLRPPLQDMRFALDAHLGRLATYLRMLGFDALYETSCDDQELSRISAQEKRILLTRDRGLLKRVGVTYGYFVRATEPRPQLLEVLRRFNLFRLLRRSSDVYAAMLCCNPSPGNRSEIGSRQERQNATTSSISALAVIACTGQALIMITCSASSSTYWLNERDQWAGARHQWVVGRTRCIFPGNRDTVGSKDST